MVLSPQHIGVESRHVHQKYVAVEGAERTRLQSPLLLLRRLCGLQVIGFNYFGFVSCRYRTANETQRARVNLAIALRLQVSLVDPDFCVSLSKAHTAAMALTALSSCVDALLAWEFALIAGRTREDDGDRLLRLGTRGIGAVAEGLPVVLAGEKDSLARELLTVGSICAGQLSVITPAPRTQVLQPYRHCLKANAVSLFVRYQKTGTALEMAEATARPTNRNPPTHTR